MAINAFNVSYANFELGTIINPDEFDVNFADIMIRLNQIIDVLNQITDGINGEGSEIIDIKEIAPFTSPKLQGFLEEVITRLQSSDHISGASFVGSSLIEGVFGDTVQEQLSSLKSLIDTLQDELTSEVERLDVRDDSLSGRMDSVDANIATVNSRIDEVNTVLSTKPDSVDVYTKTETDDIVSQRYSNADIVNMLDEKTDAIGDHAGTWQGIDVSDLADVIGASNVSISTTHPSAPYERLLWFNPSNNEYRLYLNGQWRINTRPTQIKKVHNRVTLGADTTILNIGIPDFNPEYDAFIVMQNSVFIAEGFEYDVSPDGLNISSATPWTAGTVFDFIAFIAQPAT